MQKRYFSPDIQRQFKIAWDIVPADVRTNLKKFVRYVDALEQFSDMYLYVKNPSSGCIEPEDGPLEEKGVGVAFLCTSFGRNFVDIAFNKKRFEDLRDGHAVAVMLHELAHAYDYFLKGRQADEDVHFDSETTAWGWTLKWVEAAQVPESMDRDIVAYARAAHGEDLQEAFLGALQDNLHILTNPFGESDGLAGKGKD